MIFKYVVFLIQLVVAVTAAQSGHADEYASDKNIYELTPSNFDKVIHKTNYTSIVKFYAPWCGYCKQLKPVYTKLAKFLHNDGQYAINVASVNCDKESNKALCAKYQIQGFPTLLVFRPPKYEEGKKQSSYKHATEQYNGERNVKAMSAFLTSRLKNYVKKFPNFKSDGFKSWFSKQENSKFLLITKNSQISPMLKSLAIDFIDTVKFGMVATKESSVESIEIGGVEKKLPEGTSLPALLYYNEDSGEFEAYNKTEKLNDKLKISKWVIEVTGKAPLEGALSTKEKKFYSFYRRSEKPPKGEKAPKSGKASKRKVEHDEL